MHTHQRKNKEKGKDKFYDELASATENEKGSFLYIGGDFNARLFERQSHEQEEIGTYLITREEHLTEGIADNTRNNRRGFMEFLTKIRLHGN